MSNDETITLFRPTGAKELELVKQSGFRRWPPRLEGQPIFYPVTNEQYAVEIASKWNTKDEGIGFVTRFKVRRDFIARYKIQTVGASHHAEWWIPASDLGELNENIVGLIEVIGEYKRIPRVVRLISLDTWRDGGSMSASFESDDKNRYCLFFRIIRSPWYRGWVKLGYRQPVLKIDIYAEYKSPVTGITDPDWKHESKPISWSEARAILEELKPHFDGFISNYLWVFGEMLNAATKDGRTNS